MAIEALDMQPEDGPAGALDSALDRIEHALVRLEAAAAAAPRANVPDNSVELGALRARHHKLKETVTHELRQLDLLLANLPQ